MEGSKQVSACLVVAFLAIVFTEVSTDIRIITSNFGMKGPYNSSIPFYICANGGSRYLTVLCETSLNDSVDETGIITDTIFMGTWPNGTQEVLESDMMHRSPIRTPIRPHTLLGYRYTLTFHPRSVGVFNLTCFLNKTDGTIKESDALEIRVEQDPHASSSPRVYFPNDVEMKDGQILEGQDVNVATDLCCDTTNHTHNYTCSLTTVYPNGDFWKSTFSAGMPIKAMAVSYHDHTEITAGSVLNCTITMHPDSPCEPKEVNQVFHVVKRDPPPSTTPDPNMTNDNNGGHSMTNNDLAGFVLLFLGMLALCL